MTDRSGSLFVACLLAFTARAEVVDIEVESRAVVAEGRSWGLAGPYETLTGRLRFEVDPDADGNARVTDIEYAPTNAAGAVSFSADFQLTKPVEIRSGNGAILFEAANRGRKGLLRSFHGNPAHDIDAHPDSGDGFLLEQGFSLFWIGWQFDVPPRRGYVRAHVPVATDGGKVIHGLVRSDFHVSGASSTHSLGDRGHIPYPVADPRDSRNRMTVRSAPTAERKIIPRSEWRFARSEPGRILEDPGSVYLASGFRPGNIYEVVYVAANPPIAGLGLAAIRDAVSFLKNRSSGKLSIAAGDLDRAIAYGASQSGRLLRTFLYYGFNEDEQRRKVFDGVIAHLAGGQRGGFNQRFAQPSRSGELNFFYPNAVFPFTDAVQSDPGTGTGRQDGLLAGIRGPAVPKIFYTNSSTEYWISPGALSHMTIDALLDVPPVETTRLYHFAGTQHAPARFPPDKLAGGIASNPNDYRWYLRSLLLKMDRWITDGAEPPPSRFPRLENQSLVKRDELRFPTLPGVAPPEEVPVPYRLDYGPDFVTRGIIAKEPPGLGAPYPVRVPQVDDSGNEIAGLRSPELAVPLATYTGWQPFDGDADDLYVPLGMGIYLPFPGTAADRIRDGDPRLSIEERYGDRDRYLGQVTEEALRQVDQGFLLAGDLPAILSRAARHWDYLMSGDDLPQRERQ